MVSKDSKKILKILNNTFIEQYLPFILSGIAIFSGLLTYTIINYGGISLMKRTHVVMPFIIFDVFIIVLLLVVIVDRILIIYREQKRGEIGARLHITIISIFSLVTITPSILMGILSVTFFKSGVSIWFSQPVKRTVDDASLVAELYLQEHISNIRLDAIDCANKVKAFTYNLFSEKDQNQLKKELDNIVEKHHLEEALIYSVDPNKKRTASISSSLAVFLELDFFTRDDTSATDIRNVNAGDVVIREKHGRVQALINVDPDQTDLYTYLWISKEIDQNILKYVITARDSNKYYNESLKNQHRFQTVLIILFVLSSTLLLLAAIWTGISLANILVIPITRLIIAADKVSNGDLTVRVQEVEPDNEINKLVKSFNRMTERLDKQSKDLIISEKKSTWADIARKIAHEVKNPLTPIQLAAERLKRKYKYEIRSDPATFIKCIDTIIRQVSHIGNLISEFSAFARMPEAIIAPVNINQLVRDAVFSQKQACPEIDFVIEASHPCVVFPCDNQQIYRALVNLLQNATNAINESNANHKGIVVVYVHQDVDHLLLVVEDNGPGFPKEHRDRLFEPYYTTREKGTGLGMAIVLRIITDHFGSMELSDAIGHTGARVEIRLPKLMVDNILRN
ncbi:MAG: HAMP domain-containing protein [Holosporales bacterium]|jgi:two-component system nitrogen regulation sensor histidine kinase NtrY|nr:HAMP domain-containing protein [Holosporales bacterium]